MISPTDWDDHDDNVNCDEEEQIMIGQEMIIVMRRQRW
jgi:hypothetical protein